MKRLSAVLLLCALLCALAAPALADAAYMPRDSFYEKHWDECSYEGRWYYANGAEGYVLAYKSPNTAEATPLPNGMMYYISAVYQGKWGVLEYDPDTLENTLWNGSVSGWVRMSEMVADYDEAAFEADHAAELRGESAELQLAFSDVAYGYKYPGSGVVTREFSGEFYQEGLLLSPLFTDPAGRTWGFLGYYRGRHDCWICVDDPFNSAIAPDENCVTIETRAADPEPTAVSESTPADTPAPTAAPADAGKTVELTPAADDATLKQAAKDNRGGGPWLVAGGVGVAFVAAAVLTKALRKNKEQ